MNFCLLNTVQTRVLADKMLRNCMREWFKFKEYTFPSNNKIYPMFPMHPDMIMSIFSQILLPPLKLSHVISKRHHPQTVFTLKLPQGRHTFSFLYFTTNFGQTLVSSIRSPEIDKSCTCRIFLIQNL